MTSTLLRTAASAVDLTKTYGKGKATVHALNGVTTGFDQGAFTAIMGPSGSGKSTLMLCLAGLESATSGRIMLGDQEITGMSDRQLTILRRERVGFIFQSFNLVPALTAEQNILLPGTLSGRKVDRAWLDQVVSTLGLQDRLKHRPSELSGGQQQRVAVARALLSRPEVIFADEPTGALDSHTSTQLLDFLRTCVKELGQTIVMVTHDPRAASYADRVQLLADGQIAGQLDSPTADDVLMALKNLGA